MKWYEDEVKPEVIANAIFNNSTIISGPPIEAGGLICLVNIPWHTVHSSAIKNGKSKHRYYAK